MIVGNFQFSEFINCSFALDLHLYICPRSISHLARTQSQSVGDMRILLRDCLRLCFKQFVRTILESRSNRFGIFSRAVRRANRFLVLGERLSPYVSLFCFCMAMSVLFF